jgi:hypothetical protein
MLSALVFAVLAAAHLLRALQGWPAQVAGWQVPMGLSWAAVVVGGGLAVWGFRTMARSGAL